MVRKKFRIKKKPNIKMKRDRAWRRYKKEVIHKRRIKYHFSTRSWYRGFSTPNEDIIIHPVWTDSIGHKYLNFFKNDKTENWISKNKCKYSPNKSLTYYRELKTGKFQSFGCREKDKILFNYILRENGI